MHLHKIPPPCPTSNRIDVTDEIEREVPLATPLVLFRFMFALWHDTMLCI